MNRWAIVVERLLRRRIQGQMLNNLTIKVSCFSCWTDFVHNTTNKSKIGYVQRFLFMSQGNLA